MRRKSRAYKGRLISSKSISPLFGLLEETECYTQCVLFATVHFKSDCLLRNEPMFMSPHEESTTHTEVVHSQEVVEGSKCYIAVAFNFPRSSL